LPRPCEDVCRNSLGEELVYYIVVATAW